MSCCEEKSSCSDAGDAGDATRNSVKDYYGKVLQKSEDLNTNACTNAKAPPADIKAAIARIHDEVTSRYYGCGLTIPRDDLTGLRILDLGCGTGQDCYIASQLVGESGEVVGVDMTEEQIQIANKYTDYHAKEFGYAKSNVRFLQGYIERLDELNLPSNHFDIIISNCVVNLVPDKEAVFKEAFRVLKPGGEMYFSDMYADRRIPSELKQDSMLLGEGLSGALYYNDFIRVVNRVGFTDPRLVYSSPITIRNKDVAAKTGNINYYSAVYRLWKLDNLETISEDYGQGVRYKGTISNSPHSYKLDGDHVFVKGKLSLVCGNTFTMLHDSRLAKYFEFYSSTPLVHYGAFGCQNTCPFDYAPSAGCC